MPMQQMMRIVGAVIVLIVLSLAPSVARAHAGHVHPASVHHGQGQAASAESERPATPALLQQAQSKEAGALPASDRNCVGDCCSFACAACCAAALPSPVELAPFPRPTKRVGFALSRMGPNREPESLRRPPKSLI
jgi:hypothetical protein